MIGRMGKFQTSADPTVHTIGLACTVIGLAGPPACGPALPCLTTAERLESHQGI